MSKSVKRTKINKHTNSLTHELSTFENQTKHFPKNRGLKIQQSKSEQKAEQPTFNRSEF